MDAEVFPEGLPSSGPLLGTEDWLSTPGDRDGELERLAAAAMRSLAGPRVAVDDAWGVVPARAGLYAFHAAPATWRELGLVVADVARPLYVGKAESSLRSRELATHLALGGGSKPTTGSSTLRRSFAALLRDRLDLHAVPRNKNKPGYFSMYSLEPEADARLTRWMHQHLTIAIWEKPPTLRVLVDVERRVLRAWEPPLNLADVPNPNRALRDARGAMASEARASAQV